MALCWLILGIGNSDPLDRAERNHFEIFKYIVEETILLPNFVCLLKFYFLGQRWNVKLYATT